MKQREFRSRRHGFTLVELMVVIAIGALLAAITVGGYRSIGTGNQRISCQTNLRQVYAALRQYSADYDSFAPYYDPSATTNKGLGLWALYAMPRNGSFDEVASPHSSNPSNLLPGGLKKPVGLYLRNYKQMHCPADTDNEDRFQPNGEEFERAYFSYQTQDDTQHTYLPWRGATGSCPSLNPVSTPTNPVVVTPLDRLPCRQLIRVASGNMIKRTPDDTTVVTWCKWHRFEREVDNVLFFDGVVRPIPRQQPHPSGTGNIEGWMRLP